MEDGPEHDCSWRQQAERCAAEVHSLRDLVAEILNHILTAAFELQRIEEQGTNGLSPSGAEVGAAAPRRTAVPL